jgi:hypothetical protein
MSNNHTVAMISKREVTSIFDNMPKHIYYTIRSSYKTLKVKKAQKDIQEYDYISENRHTPVHKTVMTSMVTCNGFFSNSRNKNLSLNSRSFLGGVRVVLLAIVNSCSLTPSINKSRSDC